MANQSGWKGLQTTGNREKLLTKPTDPHKIASPPGFNHRLLQQANVEQAVAEQSDVKSADAEQRDLVMNRMAWNVCISPWKQLPMSAFMMYMVGNQIGIWSIMMLGMQVFRVVSSFTGLKTTSKQLEMSDNYYLQIFIWMAGQATSLAICMWRCNSMGLLPTHPSDWLTFSHPAVATEFSTEALF